MDDRDLTSELAAVLGSLPDETGGVAIVLTTASTPPAIALLSTGDVHVDGDRVSAGVHASSSVAARLGGAFTLLVPLANQAVRIEVIDATVEVDSNLARITGTLAALRSTAEPPWVLDMQFRAQTPDTPGLGAYVAYWAGVKSWLKGTSTSPPTIPDVEH
jgi:hypothetical protein